MTRQEALEAYLKLTQACEKGDMLVATRRAILEADLFYLPETLHKADYQRLSVNLVETFVEEEYMAFPVGVHDDMFDALGRLMEPDYKLVWPLEKKAEAPPPEQDGIPDNHTAWMA